MRASVLFLVCVASCAPRNEAPAPLVVPVAESAWTVERSEPGGVLLSVWGSSPTDLWAVGGQAERGLVLHGDGTQWTPVETGALGLLWWVYGFGANDVYAAGERGLLLHYDGVTWKHVATGTTKTLFGLWGASGEDVWVVGGEATGAPGSAVILRGSRGSFTRVEDVPHALLPNALFKVYGHSADRLVAVGRDGTVLRYDGTPGTWRREDVPTSVPLISLWGRGANDLYAVGGHSEAVMLHFDGVQWREVPDLGAGPELFGVFTAPGQPVIAVGAGTQVLELMPGKAAVAHETPDIGVPFLLHSVWGDASGAVYAVGGSLLDYPAPMRGVILRRR